MADQAQVFVRQELVPQRPAPVRTTGADRLGPVAAVRFADQHPSDDRQRAAALLHRRAGDPVPADRCGLAGQRPQRVPGRECRACGRRVLAVRAGEAAAVHVRLLSAEPALARQPGVPDRHRSADPAADPAHPRQDAECDAVLLRVSGGCVLPAVWRRHQGLRHQLAGRPARGDRRQHRRWRPPAARDGRRRSAGRASRSCWRCSASS